ncbi:hypothetical protein BGZ72_008012, partial [Mortierella alpina]
LSQDGYDPAEEAELDLDVDLDLDLDQDLGASNNNNTNNNNDHDASQEFAPLGSGDLGQYPDSSSFGTDMDLHHHHQFYSAPIEPGSELDLDRDLDLDLDLDGDSPATQPAI